MNFTALCSLLGHPVRASYMLLDRRVHLCCNACGWFAPLHPSRQALHLGVAKP